jgi:hypothetical protein
MLLKIFFSAFSAHRAILQLVDMMLKCMLKGLIDVNILMEQLETISSKSSPLHSQVHVQAYIQCTCSYYTDTVMYNYYLGIVYLIGANYGNPKPLKLCHECQATNVSLEI